jgi:diguanylate cyclase (GGDEF)-like protein
MPDWPEGRFHSVTGNPVRDSEGRLLGAVNVGRDVTSKKSMEEKVRSAALSDELTGLYNRRGFMLMAEQQLRLAIRHGQLLQLLFIDLDGMKHINDVFGHDVGDDALIDAAMLLTRSCRTSDTIARLGGDEFVVMAQGDSSSSSALRGRLIAAVLDYNEHSGCEYELSLSIGIAAFDPKQPVTLPQLLADADRAMYEMKRRRRSGALDSKAN